MKFGGKDASLVSLVPRSLGERYEYIFGEKVEKNPQKTLKNLFSAVDVKNLVQLLQKQKITYLLRCVFNLDSGSSNKIMQIPVRKSRIYCHRSGIQVKMIRRMKKQKTKGKRTDGEKWSCLSDPWTAGEESGPHLAGIIYLVIRNLRNGKLRWTGFARMVTTDVRKIHYRNV